jgi:hypothetical protein
MRANRSKLILGLASASVLAAAPVAATSQDMAEDTNPNGACVHMAFGRTICSSSTRKWCFGAGFVSARFYENMSCDEARANGYF